MVLLDCRQANWLQGPASPKPKLIQKWELALQMLLNYSGVFTPVCLSVHRGESASLHAGMSRPSPRSRRLLLRTVRILLECILVFIIIMKKAVVYNIVTILSFIISSIMSFIMLNCNILLFIIPWLWPLSFIMPFIILNYDILSFIIHWRRAQCCS